MMAHAWRGYTKYAWGSNEVKPITLQAHRGSVFGSADLGATIVDAMDTLFIMDLDSEYKEARNWVEEFLDFNQVVRQLLYCARVLGCVCCQL